MATKKKATHIMGSTTESKPIETATQKFIRLANFRTSRAIKVIHQIGNLGGPGYESTDEHRAKIEAALTDAVKATMNRLNKNTVKPSGFSL